MPQIIIGLAARAGHGKSTVAQWFQSQYGNKVRVVSFAAPLKAMGQLIYDLRRDQLYGTQEQKDAIDPRYGRSGRQLLQFLGTEVCRNHLGQDIWVKTLFETSIPRAAANVDAPTIFIVEDVRFPNEAKAIQAHGGRVIKLVCPDAPPPQDTSHASEASVDLIEPDLTITSTRVEGVEDLKAKVASALWLPQLRPFQPELHAAAREVREAAQRRLEAVKDQEQLARENAADERRAHEKQIQDLALSVGYNFAHTD